MKLNVESIQVTLQPSSLPFARENKNSIAKLTRLLTRIKVLEEFHLMTKEWIQMTILISLLGGFNQGKEILKRISLSRSLIYIFHSYLSSYIIA